MSKILVVSGHTDLKNSFANKIILDELKRLLPEAKFDILSESFMQTTVQTSQLSKKN